MERTSLNWMDEVSRKKTLQAWAANQRELSLARSQVGLRCASRDMVGAGHHMYFDLPHEYDNWRACAVLRMKPQEGTSPRHRRNYPGWSSLNATGLATAGGESFTSSHTLTGAFAGEAHGPVSGDTTMQGGIPYSLSAGGQHTETAGSASGYALDKLLYTQTGLAQYDIPVTYDAELFFGGGTDPVWVSDPSDGNFAATFPLARTLAERPALLPAATIRPATDEDHRLARMQPDEEGRRPEGAQLLPAHAHVNSAIGSAELISAFQQLLTGRSPGDDTADAPAPGALARILNWTAEHGSQVGTLLPGFVTQPAQWLKDVTFGQSLAYPENPAQESARAALSSTSLLALVVQIARGGYSYHAGSAGSLMGTEVQGEVRGYLHDVQYLGVGTPPEEGFTGSGNWMESDVTATDAAWRGRGGKRTAQLGFSGSVTRADGDVSGSVTGSGSQSFAVSWSVSDTDSVFSDRMNVEAREPHHAFRADFTYLSSLSVGHVNALANALGVGPQTVRTLATHVPGALVFWVSETGVREDPRLAELAGLTPHEPTLDRRLPPFFVRSGGRALGPATVPETLPDGPLDAFVEALRAEAERVAPGSLTPGSGSYVYGLDSRITQTGSAIGTRALVGAGADRWLKPITFVYRGRGRGESAPGVWGGLYRVTLSVNARPAPDRDLGEVRGALRPKSGLENIYSSTPSSVTRTAARSGTFSLSLSPSAGFPVVVGTDNAGSAGVSASFASNSSRSTSLTLSPTRQQWVRTYAPAAQFDVAYEFRATASAELLPDTLPGFLVNQVVSLKELTELLVEGGLSAGETLGLRRLLSRMADGMTELPSALAAVLGRTPDAAAEDGTLPPPVTATGATGEAIPLDTLTASGERTEGNRAAPVGGTPAAERDTAEPDPAGPTEPAEATTSQEEPQPGTPVSSTPFTVHLRFPAHETPYERADGTVDWSTAPELLTPQLHESDPRQARPLPEPATGTDTDPDTGTDTDPATGTAEETAPAGDPLAAAARWTPQQTLIVGDFDAVDELADALRAVDPALRDGGLPKTSESQESTMLRIGNLVGSGKVALTAAQASRFTGKRPSGSSSSVRLDLYRPQTESSSRTLVLMGIRVNIRSASSSGSQTYSPSANVPLSGGLTEGNTDTPGRGGPRGGGEHHHGEVDRRLQLPPRDPQVRHRPVAERGRGAGRQRSARLHPDRAHRAGGLRARGHPLGDGQRRGAGHPGRRPRQRPHTGPALRERLRRAVRRGRERPPRLERRLLRGLRRPARRSVHRGRRGPAGLAGPR
ncbi:hypothetical protein IHE61_27090 [Streptomyces sp. GKU 257-1]|nr:hypothetical protein [Streptomyces sp. GKU 257-1]